MSIQPVVTRGYGTTWFHMEAAMPVTGVEPPPENSDYIGVSELEYPLDVFLAGGRVDFVFGNARGRSLHVTLGGWGNFSPPSSTMVDSDWFGVRSQSGSSSATSLFKFSRTESETKLETYGGEAGIFFGGYRLLDRPVAYGVVVRVEAFAFEMTGVKGWQRAPGEAAVAVDDFHGQRVLTYDLLRITPRFQSDLLLGRASRLDWHVLLSASPAAMASDHDNHPLRMKESTTTAYGFELGGATELRLHVSAHADMIAGVDLYWLWSKGAMEQHFYGDDPNTGNDETGTRFSVDNRIKGLAGGLSLGMRFLL